MVMPVSEQHIIPYSPAALVGDVISAGAIIGTIIGYLPYVAAFAGLVWYLIQIWESKTVQGWWCNRRMVRGTKKIARLQAREKIIQAQLQAMEDLHRGN